MTVYKTSLEDPMVGVDDVTWRVAADAVAGAAATVSAMAASTGRFMACTLHDRRRLRPTAWGVLIG